MGTNYYLYEKPACEHCGRDYEDLHIGKSSAGWCFSLHVIPEDGINDLPDWQERWSKPGAIIKNEYGDVITPKGMNSIIADRNCGDSWESNSWFGYRSEAQFHERNYSERGPNGLLRHCIGTHCIKHGDGTWDCISGEFS